MDEHALALSAGEIAVRLGIVLLLVLANGFFVAAEFALVASRLTRVRAMARAGIRRAKIAAHAIERLDHYLSATQLGITLASIGLGFVGEATMAAILTQAFDGLPYPFSVLAAHAVAITIAYIFITVLHIVLGELAPKSLAILHPESVSLWTAPPLALFTKVLAPFIWVLNGSANLLLRSIGMEAPHEAERVHRPEEIEMLVAQSHEHGLLSDEPVEMIRGVFDLSETPAGEVMTPRTDIIALGLGSTMDEAAELIISAGHSRVPVYGDSLDDIRGVILARDVWQAQRRGDRRLAALVRAVPFVPDGKPIEDLLREMQQSALHMVIVVDEFGGTAGLVTLEDVMEEIVGEIRDEHERDEPPPIADVGSGQIVVEGGVTLADLNDRYDLDLPEDEFTTVGGYVMGRLGRLPEAGEEVAFGKGVLEVIAMDGRRIERLFLSLNGEDEVVEDGSE
ncbi:MAG: hemolysin family protein [Longimicrobiales bacterium]